MGILSRAPGGPGKTALVAELADWAWHSLINRAGSPHKPGLLIDCDDFAHDVPNVLLRREYGPNRPRDILATALLLPLM